MGTSLIRGKKLLGPYSRTRHFSRVACQSGQRSVEAIPGLTRMAFTWLQAQRAPLHTETNHNVGVDTWREAKDRVKLLAAEEINRHTSEIDTLPCGRRVYGLDCLQGELTYKKHPPPRTLQQD